jgi:putative spermidine/putrescine transport system ATP-binding protein
VRRDRIQLERAASIERELNALRGVVHAIEYQGSYVKVTLDIPGWPEFVAYVSDERFFAAPVDIGDAVVARWSAQDVRVLEADVGRAAATAETPLYREELGLAQA